MVEVPIEHTVTQQLPYKRTLPSSVDALVCLPSRAPPTHPHPRRRTHPTRPPIPGEPAPPPLDTLAPKTHLPSEIYESRSHFSHPRTCYIRGREGTRIHSPPLRGGESGIHALPATKRPGQGIQNPVSTRGIQSKERIHGGLHPKPSKKHETTSTSLPRACRTMKRHETSLGISPL